jgi:hypothetical protein
MRHNSRVDWTAATAPGLCAVYIRPHLFQLSAHVDRVLHQQVAQAVHAHLAALRRAAPIVQHGQGDVHLRAHALLVARAQAAVGLCLPSHRGLPQQREGAGLAGGELAFQKELAQQKGAPRAAL